jgi:hypothetical protein
MYGSGLTPIAGRRSDLQAGTRLERSCAAAVATTLIRKNRHKKRAADEIEKSMAGRPAFRSMKVFSRVTVEYYYRTSICG